jgi:transposase
MEFISGENRKQVLLLPDTIESYVDANSTVRVLEAYVQGLNVRNLGFMHAELNATGRPPYNPKDLLKLYVYGYMNRIRSSRRLEAESKRNLEVQWLLGKLTPDHKTIARFRHENAEALKEVFRDFVKLCSRKGLYGKELLALDGSKFKANNSKARNFTQKQLQERIKRIEGDIGEYLAELEQNDAVEAATEGPKSREEIGKIIEELLIKKERYEGYEKELSQTGEKQVSLTDPDSRLMRGGNGTMAVSYNVQTAVDAKNKLVVEFEVSNQGNDKNFITPITMKAQELLATDRITVVTDGGYESIHDMLCAMGQGIDVHVAGTDFDICVPADDGVQRTIHTHKEGRCVYIAERNIALCPMGNVLYPTYVKKSKGRMVGVFYHFEACKHCSCKCTTDARGRFRYLVPMAKESFSKDYNDKGLTVKQVRIAAKKAIVKQRKSLVEHPFGTIKNSMAAGNCLTRGLRNVRGEFSLTFLAYNIKRAISILGCKELIAGMT